MAKRLTSEDRLVRAATAFLKHQHGSGFHCVYCKSFEQRLRNALEVYGTLESPGE